MKKRKKREKKPADKKKGRGKKKCLRQARGKRDVFGQIKNVRLSFL